MAAPGSPDAVLNPRLLSATAGLALTARRLVEGAVAGLHASRRPGLAREFSQYRAYQPGDETRHIDWKLFGRSDRYYLRESEIDTRVVISLLLDATESMQHRGGGAEVPRKFELASSLVAALALLAENQGDPATLQIVANGDVATVLTAGHHQPFRRIVQALDGVAPAGRWPTDPRRLTEALRRAENTAKRSGPGMTARLTVILTDGHQHGEEIRAALAPLRAQQHELLFLHLVAPDEREFPYRGPVQFEEWETGRNLEADGAAVRYAFLAAEQRESEAWSRAWGDDRFDYLRLLTNEPPERALRIFLRRRLQR